MANPGNKHQADGGESPISVLRGHRNHRILRHQTICSVHLRDFSDCVHLHTAQHPYWDDINSVLKFSRSLAIPRHRATAAWSMPRAQSRSVIPSDGGRLRTPWEVPPPKRLMVAREDPIKVLGPDIMRSVLTRLDARSLARSGVISRDWRGIAHADELWTVKIASSPDYDEPLTCAGLWEGKRHIPAAALVPGLSKLAVYGISIKDSERRLITLDDLCNHAWEYRFKDTVPEYFLALDPSRRGEPPMRRFFHSDGFQTAGPGDEVWGGHESTFRIVPGGGGATSNFVRINHWPEMEVCRTGDWGWELHNHICSYRSLPDSENGGTGHEHIP